MEFEDIKQFESRLNRDFPKTKFMIIDSHLLVYNETIPTKFLFEVSLNKRNQDNEYQMYACLDKRRISSYESLIKELELHIKRLRQLYIDLELDKKDYSNITKEFWL